MAVNAIYSLESRLSPDRRLLIMGIVNVTPDSFSDGGQYLECDHAVAHALELVRQGADILDLGAESTRPGSQPVPAAMQIERLLPVLRKLREHTDIPVSIDTTSAAVAACMLENSADIINDISAARFDDNMLQTCKAFNAPIILMHMQGKPQNMQQNPVYDDVVTEVCAFLRDAALKAEAAGLACNQIILDPGLGFGKTLEHNLELMRNIPELKTLGYPLLIAASRKTFLRTLLTGDRTKPAPLNDLDTATNVTTMLSLMGGADMVRVHNVKGAVDTVKILAALD